MTIQNKSTPLQTALDDLNLGASSTSPSTIQSVVDLAIEVAREGREGRKIGTLFTVGAEQDVLARSRSLIRDPLAGHPPEDRRIDDPPNKQPLGLGTRHLAAASISTTTTTIAVWVSESSVVRVYSSGRLGRPVRPARSGSAPTGRRS